MGYKNVARSLVTTFAATLIGMSLVPIFNAESSLQQNTIAGNDPPICGQNKDCFPPPV